MNFKIFSTFALTVTLSMQVQAKTPATKKTNTTTEPIVKVPSCSRDHGPLCGQEGHGGGGVKKDGIYMTFYSAGLYVEPSENSDLPTRIPALNILSNYIAHLPTLSDRSKMTLLNAIIPTANRRYFIATPQSLTPEIKGRLLAEFSRVTNMDASQLELFALTDTTTRTTFILPEFFKLNSDDQVAILFHEGYWIIHSDISYNQIVAAEMAFEAAYKEPNNPARVYDFLKYVGATNEIFKGQLRWDIAQGNLNGFLRSDNTFSLEDLLGKDFFDCAVNNVGLQFEYRQAMGGGYSSYNVQLNGGTAVMARSICFPYLRLNINKLREKFPASFFLRSIAARADQDDLYGSFETYLDNGLFIAYNTWLFSTLGFQEIPKIMVDSRMAGNLRPEYINYLRTCMISLDEKLIDTTNMICTIGKGKTFSMHFKLYSSQEGRGR